MRILSFRECMIEAYQVTRHQMISELTATNCHPTITYRVFKGGGSKGRGFPNLPQCSLGDLYLRMRWPKHDSIEARQLVASSADAFVEQLVEEREYQETPGKAKCMQRFENIHMYIYICNYNILYITVNYTYLYQYVL